MCKRISLVALGAALIAMLVVGLASGASGPTKHHFVLKDRGTYLKTTAGYPSPGGRALQVGVSRMKIGGDVKRGTTKRRVEILSIDGRVVKFKATSIAYDRSGSSKSRLHGPTTFNDDGSASVTGKGRIVGGSGAYRGATGELTLTGTVPEPPKVGTIIVGRAKGTIKY